MDMHDVLEKLKQLEKSPEQEQAVKSAEAMTQAPETTAEAPVPAPEKPQVPQADVTNTVQNISATGEGLFKEYEGMAQNTTSDDLATLAGVNKDQ